MGKARNEKLIISQRQAQEIAKCCYSSLLNDMQKVKENSEDIQGEKSCERSEVQSSGK